MQFVVLAQDCKDEGALERRKEAREAHLAMIDKYKKSGNMICGAALIDETNGNMVGSTIICDFPSMDELQAWLNEEPYITQNVWEKLDIMQCKVGPSFL